MKIDLDEDSRPAGDDGTQRRAAMSETVVFGFLRLVRGFVGIYAGASAIGLLAGIPALFRVHQDGKIAAVYLANLGFFIGAAIVYVLLANLIHGMHRSSFGTPHPKLKSFFSL